MDFERIPLSLIFSERRTYLKSVRDDFERNGVNVDDDDDQATTHRLPIKSSLIKPSQPILPDYPEDTENQENEVPEPNTDAVPKQPKSRPLRDRAAKKNFVKTGNEVSVAPTRC